MVYETKTFKICHQLTQDGKEKYNAILESAADEILYRNEHPLKWIFQKIKNSVLKQN